MGMFIGIVVNEEGCSAGQPCMECVKGCPVNIFAYETRLEQATVIPDAEDECILCDLCLNHCPTDAIRIHRLYENDSPSSFFQNPPGIASEKRL